MSDLMREEFEQAVIESLVAEGYSVRSAVEVMERGSDGEYRSVRFNGAWWGWQASRECLVIGLPNRFDEKYQDYYDDVEGGCFNEGRYINDAQEALTAAGVKYK